jgi:hypothetical protein
MNEYDGGLDDELASFTDRVLNGEDGVGADAPGDLGGVVRTLHQGLSVDRAQDDEARERIRQRLAREWSDQHRAGVQLPVRSQTARRMLLQPVRYWSRAAQLLAAAVLLIVLIGTVLVAGDSDEGGLQGTASGSGSTLVPLAVVLIILILAVGWWLWGKRTKR